MATIISKTSYGNDTAYYSNGNVMAKRRGNDESHLISIDASAMETQIDWQNWLNETAYLENIGEVSICDCPFNTDNDEKLIKENVFG